MGSSDKALIFILEIGLTSKIHVLTVNDPKTCHNLLLVYLVENE